MADSQEQSRIVRGIEDVRSLADIETLLAAASADLIHLAAVGKIMGLSTPATDEMLSASAANIATAALNIDRAKSR